MPVRNINGSEMKSISDVSKETGISNANIRKYRDKGLISATTTQQESLTYLWFDEASIFRLKMIKMFRELDVSLDEIQATFENPNLDHNALLDQLIAKLQKRRDEINRQIEFCELAKSNGLKGMALIAASSGSIDTYMMQYKEVMQCLMPQIETTADDDLWDKGVVQKLKSFQSISAFAPTSNEAQLYMDALVGDLEKLVLGFMLGKGEVSDYGTRVLMLFILGYMILSQGTLADLICENAGKSALDYVAQATVYCVFRTIDTLFSVLRTEYEQCKTDQAKNEYLLNARERFCKWMSIFNPYMDLQDDDDILEIAKDFLEMESGDMCDPDAASELYQEITKAWAKLPL